MIESLFLDNVRTFKRQKFEFTEGLNLIIGKNGTGKTTILESIGMLGFGKYLSLSQDSYAIATDQEAGRIEARLKGGLATEVEIGFSKKEKIINIDGRRSPVSNLIGLQPQVFFNPQTVELVFDSPALRRRELDMVLAQCDHEFVMDILNFKKILKQRNSLLRLIKHRRTGEAELEFWNKKFGEFAMKIYNKRQELLDFHSSKISSLFSSLTSDQRALSLKYLPSGDYERLEEMLVAHLEGDLESGTTSIGPHRDDFSFMLDKKPMRQGASRGEQRLAAVAFKAASSEYLIERGIDPIIILDDVFSELDNSRQASVSETMGLFKVSQVFVSATDREALPEILLKNANIINL